VINSNLGSISQRFPDTTYRLTTTAVLTFKVIQNQYFASKIIKGNM